MRRPADPRSQSVPVCCLLFACVTRGPFSLLSTPLLTLAMLVWLGPTLWLLGWWPPSALAHPIGELQHPQSFIAHPAGDAYFIANANGEPGQADQNGFISKLDQHGTMLDLHFIQGGRGDTILHAPHGMAIVGDILYVADINVIRGFHAASGKPMVTVSFQPMQIEMLTDLIADGVGQLFVLDTRGNAIYQVDPHNHHAVSLYVQHEDLASPRGVAVHPQSGRLLVASLDQGTVMEIAEDRTITEVISNSMLTGRFQHLSGIDFDRFGSMYLSDLTAGKIWQVYPDQSMHVIAEFLISPAAVKIDRLQHRILVPYLYANGAEMNSLEHPINSGTHKKRRRTLSDYGLGGFQEDTRP